MYIANRPTVLLVHGDWKELVPQHFCRQRSKDSMLSEKVLLTRQLVVYMLLGWFFNANHNG